MKFNFILTLFILFTLNSFAQKHELTLSTRYGVPGLSLSNNYVLTNSQFDYANVQTSKDIYKSIGYSFLISKKFNVLASVEIGTGNTQNFFPILAKESLTPRIIHLVDYKSQRLQVGFFGLKKRFSNKQNTFSLDFGFMFNRRYYNEGRVQLLENEWQVANQPWIEYRYDIEIIQDEFKKDFRHGPNNERVNRFDFSGFKLDWELSGNWRINKNLDFSFGLAYSPNHIFFYDADWESRQYTNGELNPDEFVDFVGVVADFQGYNGLGKKNNFFYLTTGLTYKFMKKERQE